MRVIERTEATAPLVKYTTEVKKEPVIVTRKGKPIAALCQSKTLISRPFR